MYRTAPERKTVKVEYRLNNNEVEEAIFNFLKSKNKIPEGQTIDDIIIVCGQASGTYPRGNFCKISLDEEILTIK